MPFQQEFLTGGTSMRGWLNNQFRGDFRALVNVEYSLPLFEIEGLQFRGLGFWDSAYTTFLTTDNPERNYLPNATARGLKPFKNRSASARGCSCARSCCRCSASISATGSRRTTSQIYLAIGLTD